MDLNALIGMSEKYGANPEFVLGGGGNTSYKEAGIMAVKASGTVLASIGEEGFVSMDVEKLCALTKAAYPEDDKLREARALKDMMDARLKQNDFRRPSVECILHALFRQSYVLHVHPAIINGLTCGKNGAENAAMLFDDLREKFLWVPLTKPGYILSKTCADLFSQHKEIYGQEPTIMLLQNHGVFVAADSVPEIDQIMEDVVSRISKKIVRKPDLDPENGVPEGAKDVAKMLDGIYGGTSLHLYNEEIARMAKEREPYASLMKPFTPDHIVYCRAYPLFAEKADRIGDAFSEYVTAHGYKPKVVVVGGLGVFALGKDANEARLVADLVIDSIKIAVYSESFGGPLALPDAFTDFITNWESEAYRQSMA